MADMRLRKVAGITWVRWNPGWTFGRLGWRHMRHARLTVGRWYAHVWRRQIEWNRP